MSTWYASLAALLSGGESGASTSPDTAGNLLFWFDYSDISSLTLTGIRADFIDDKSGAPNQMRRVSGGADVVDVAGNPALRFESGDRYDLDAGVGLPPEFTYIMVATPQDLSNGLPAFWRTTSGTPAQGSDFFAVQSNGYPWIRINGNNNFNPSTGATVSTGTQYIFVVRLSVANGLQLFINGDEPYPATAYVAPSTDQITSIHYNFFTSQIIVGDYFEHMLYDAALDAATLNNLGTYFVGKHDGTWAAIS